MLFEKAPASLREIGQLESEKQLSESLSFKTAYEVIEAAAKRWPEKAAIHFLPDSNPATSINITYAQLLARINQAANLFLDTQKNADQGNVVSYILPNIPQTHYVLWGAMAVGVVNPLRPDLSAEQIVTLLKKAKSTTLVTVGEYIAPSIWETVLEVQKRYPALKTIFVIGGQANPEQGIYDFDQSLEKQSEQFSQQRLVLNEICAYFHTSATTRLDPKLVRLTRHGFVYMAWALGTCLGYKHEDIIGVGLPFFHVGAPMVGGLVPFMCGASTVLMGPMGWRSPDLIKNFWLIVSEYKITVTAALNFMYEQILQNAIKGSTLRLGVSGTPISKDVAEKYLEHEVKIADIYGSSETIVACFNPPADSAAGSMGFPLPYQQMKIVRQNGEECSANEVGELWVSGPNVTRGYQGEDDVAEFEWLKTEDLARRDEKGRYWFFDRVADAIHHKNGLISSLWLEHAFEKHPKVARVAVIGQPDALKGEVPILYAMPKPGMELKISDLQSWAREQNIDPEHCPVEWHIRSEFPLNGIAKIIKPVLRIENAKDFWTKTIRGLFDEESPAFSIDIQYNKRGQMDVKVAFTSAISEIDEQKIQDKISSFHCGFIALDFQRAALSLSA